LQTSPFPLGYRASDAQYSETALPFQHASAGLTARFSSTLRPPFRLIERLLRERRSR